MGDLADELTHLWGSFSLKVDESDQMAIEEAELAPLLSKGDSCVVGKLLADRTMGEKLSRRL